MTYFIKQEQNFTIVFLLKQKQKNKQGIFQKTPSQLNTALNRDLDRIVAKALAYSPEDRFTDCAAFAKTLKWYRRRYLPESRE